METKVLKIEGMSCAHCQKAVAEALQSLEGVSNVEVSLERGEAKLSYDPAKVSDQAIKAAIEEAGYEVVAG